MDKYEYHIRIEQIQSLLEEERYADAMAVCDEIDWKKEKKISMLINVSRIYRYNKRYEDARAILNIAYDRYPGDREVVYELCELAIRMREVVAAQEFYKEYCNVAPKDPMQYILKYKIFEFLDTSLEERISVLEEFKRKDNYSDDRWAYELAYLYYKIGLYAKCVDECDELITWFGQGEYVLKAMELKMLIKPLNSRQQGLYNAMSGRKAVAEPQPYEDDEYLPDDKNAAEEYSDDAEMESGADAVYADEDGFIPTTADEDSIEVRTLNVDKYSTMNIQDELSNSVQEFFEGEGVRVKEENEEYYPENDGRGYEESEEYYADDVPEGELTEDIPEAMYDDDYADEYPDEYADKPEDDITEDGIIEDGIIEDGIIEDGIIEETENVELNKSESDSDSDTSSDDETLEKDEADAIKDDAVSEDYYDEEEGPFEDENGEIYYIINGEVYYEDELYYPDEDYEDGEYPDEDYTDEDEYADEAYEESEESAEDYEDEKADAEVAARDEAAEKPVVEKMSDEEIEQLRQNREKRVSDIREAASRDIAILSNTGRLPAEVAERTESQLHENPVTADEIDSVDEPVTDESNELPQADSDGAVVRNVEDEVPVRLLETEEIFSDEIEEQLAEATETEVTETEATETEATETEALETEATETETINETETAVENETPDVVEETETVIGPQAEPETAAVSEPVIQPEPEKSGTAKLAEIVGNARQAEINNNAKLVNALKNELKNEKSSQKPSFREITPDGGTGDDKNMEKLLSQDSDGQLSLVVPDQEAVDKQITGQMNLDSFLIEWEKQNRENQRNRIAAAKRKSLEQTNDILSQLKGVIPDDLTAPLPTLEELAREITLPDENIDDKAMKADNSPEVKRMPIASKPKTKKISEPETPKDNLKVRSTSSRKNAEELLNEPTVGKVIMPPEEKPIYKTRAEQLEDDKKNQMSESEYDESAVPKDDFETGHLPRTDEEEVFMASLGEEYLDEYEQQYSSENDELPEVDYIDEDNTSQEDYDEVYMTEESYERTYLSEEPYEEEDYVSNEPLDEEYEESYEEPHEESYEEEGYSSEELYEMEGETEQQDYRAEETGYEEAGYEETGYEETGYKETGYEETGYEQDVYEEQGTYEEQDYEGQDYEEPDYEETPYQGEPAVENSGYLEDEDDSEGEEDVTDTSDASDLEEFFGDFLDMRNMKKKLREALPQISMNPIEGNVVLTGNEAAVRVKLALAIAKSVQAENPEFTGRIAKVDAETLNTKDIRRAFNAMNNGAVVIEQAGRMTVNTLNTMAKCINHSSVRMLLILEDEKAEIRKLEKLRAYFSKMFNVTINVPTYSNNELVDYAKRYALGSECVIDEMGVLALFKRIDDMQTSDHYVTIDEVEEIIDRAIRSAEKKSLSHFKDVLFAKRYDDDDNLIIRERDFE